MKFYLFHFMTYPHAPTNFRDSGYKSLWMDHPNHYYDPKKGHALYERYLGEYELADRLGFDGVVLNEHHQTPQSMMPAPNVLAGAVSQRVKSGRILILGRALPIVSNPFSVAEEFSMLDNITGGRLITGFVRGVGIEYHGAAINPVDSQARYKEAHEIIIKAWTSREPFSYYGKHYQFPHLNLFPPPVQQPHPPVWIPSTGSKDTIEWAADPSRRYTYLQFFNRDYEGVKGVLNTYKETARRYGYEAGPEQLGWATPIYVAETDKQARDEAAEHIEVMFNEYMFMTQEMLIPPGYLSVESIKAVLAAKVGLKGRPRTKIDDLITQRRCLIGSPATVRSHIEQAIEEIGIGHMPALLHFGTLPQDLTQKNIELFAAEVMKPIREKYGIAPDEIRKSA